MANQTAVNPRTSIITFRVTPEEKKELENVVRKQGYKSLSSFMQAICQEYIKELKK